MPWKSKAAQSHMNNLRKALSKCPLDMEEGVAREEPDALQDEAMPMNPVAVAAEQQ